MNQTGREGLLRQSAEPGENHAVVAPAGSRVAYIAGQGGMDSTGTLSPDFAVQVKQAYTNLRTVLDGVGAKPD